MTISTLTNGPISVGPFDSLPSGPLSYVWYTSMPGNYIKGQGPSACCSVHIFMRKKPGLCNPMEVKWLLAIMLSNHKEALKIYQVFANEMQEV